MQAQVTRRSFGPLLLLALASCRSPAPTTAAGSDPPPPAGGAASGAEAPAAAPATPSMVVQSRTVRMDDDSTVFGFAAYGGRWVIGTALTDSRSELALRPVAAEGIGPALHVLPSAGPGGFPTALVGEADPTHAPWVISAQDGKPWRFVARRFDGGGEVTVLEIPDDPHGITRTAFRAGERPIGAIVYAFEQTRPLTKAERRAALAEHRKHEKAGEHDVPLAGESVSPHKTLAHGMRYFGTGAGQPFEGARVPAGDPVHLGWLAAARGRDGWLGAHWEQRHTGDAIVESHIALHWFDAGSTHVRSTTVAAPKGTSSGQLVLALDGTAYVVADRSSPGDAAPVLELLAFDPAGAPLPTRLLPVPGWVADTITSVDCSGHTWLLFDAYAQSGEEVIAALPLAPRGKLEGTVLWSRRDPRPAGSGSRPGRALHAACDGQQAAVAMHIWDVELGHELGLAVWDADGEAR